MCAKKGTGAPQDTWDNVSALIFSDTLYLLFIPTIFYRLYDNWKKYFVCSAPEDLDPEIDGTLEFYTVIVSITALFYHLNYLFVIYSAET